MIVTCPEGMQALGSVKALLAACPGGLQGEVAEEWVAARSRVTLLWPAHPLGRWIPGGWGVPPVLGLGALAYLVVVVRPMLQAVAFLAAWTPRTLQCNAPAPHDRPPCRPPLGHGRARNGQSSRGGLTTRQWLAPAGCWPVEGTRALCPGQTRMHQGPKALAICLAPPGATTGAWGCASAPPAAAAREDRAKLRRQLAQATRGRPLPGAAPVPWLRRRGTSCTCNCCCGACCVRGSADNK